MENKKGSFYIILVVSTMTVAAILLLPAVKVRMPGETSTEFVNVTVPCSGYGAAQVEREVTSRVEATIALLPETRELKSQTYDGFAVVTAAAKRRVDMGRYRFRIAAAMHDILPEMPDYASTPRVTLTGHQDSKDQCILKYYLYGGPDLMMAAENFRQNIFGEVQENLRIDLEGGENESIRLQMRPDHILYDDDHYQIFRHLLQEEGPVTIYTGNEVITVAMERDQGITGMLRAGKTSGDRIWHVADRLHNRWEAGDIPLKNRVNNKEAIIISIDTPRGGNMYFTGRRVRQATEKARASLPQGIAMIPSFDVITKFDDEIHRTGKTWMILATIFPVFLAGGWRLFIATLSAYVTGVPVTLSILMLTGTGLYPGSFAYLLTGLALVLPWSLVIAYAIKKCRLYEAVLSLAVATLIFSALAALLSTYTERVADEKITALIISTVVSFLQSALFLPALLGQPVRRNRPMIPVHCGWMLFWRILRGKPWLYVRLVTIMGCFLFFGFPAGDLFGGTDRGGLFSRCKNMVQGTMGILLTDLNRNKQEIGPDTSIRVLFGFPPGTDRQDSDSLIMEFGNCLHSLHEDLIFITSELSFGMAGIEIRLPDHPDNKGRLFRDLENSLTTLNLAKGGLSWHILGNKRSYHSSGNSAPANRLRLKITGYELMALHREKKRIISELKKNPRIRIVEKAVKDQMSMFSEDIVERYDYEGLHSGKIGQVLQEFSDMTYDHPGVGRVTLSMEGTRNNTKWELWNKHIMKASLKPSDAYTDQVIRRCGQEYFSEIMVEYLGLRNSGEVFITNFLKQQDKSLPAGFHLSFVKNDNLQADRTDIWIFAFSSIILTFMILAIFMESLDLSLYITILLMFLFSSATVLMQHYTGWPGEMRFMITIFLLNASAGWLIFLFQHPVLQKSRD